MDTGRNYIAGERRTGSDTFQAVEAASGRPMERPFHVATPRDVADACAAAAAAQPAFAALDPAERASFLRMVADRIDGLGDRLTRIAMAETGLPEARLNGERGRTVGQLRLFADEVESGRWQRVRVDPADPARLPPRPDLRLRMIPLGPVGVFGASNFPLAFSVAGGDTASAWAAGCCVVVKGHPAHPGTSDLVADAITSAVADSGLPGGVFSLVHGPGNRLGEALVSDPHIKAVGFTGSRAGGLALVAHAAARPVPIPVYAEMSSVNPVVLLPDCLDRDAEALASAYVASLALGAGQFCTNPGLVLAIEGPALERFLLAAGAAVAGVEAQTMLTPVIGETFRRGVGELAGLPGVNWVGFGTESAGKSGRAQIFTVAGSDFRASDAYAAEVFGPTSLVVRCADLTELRAILERLEGQLTATLHLADGDHPLARDLLPVLEGLAGRILVNGWPTGVEVAHAMVHGGPFPATSDGRSTSVGTLAIERFLRPVCYQNFPDELLPAALRDAST